VKGRQYRAYQREQAWTLVAWGILTVVALTIVIKICGQIGWVPSLIVGAVLWALFRVISA